MIDIRIIVIADREIDLMKDQEIKNGIDRKKGIKGDLDPGVGHNDSFTLH